MKIYITMKDIATRLALSRSTISFALNDRYNGIRISDEVRDKIKRTAKEMGYYRNAVVQSLVSGKTRTVAYVAEQSVYYEYTFRTITGIIQELSERGYSVRFFIKHPGISLEELFQQIVEQRIEGIFTRTNDIETITYFLKRGRERKIPLLNLDKTAKLDGGIYVNSDDYTGTLEAIEHLYSLGHRHIGHFGLYNDPTDERNSAFHRAIEGFNIINRPEDNVFSSEPTEQRRLAGEILFRPISQRCTAYVCASDYIATILTIEAVKKNVTIPDELSIIGFGALNDIKLLNPDLSTIAQPFEEIGKCAAKLLIQEIESENQLSFEHAIEKHIKTNFIKCGLTTSRRNGEIQ